MAGHSNISLTVAAYGSLNIHLRIASHFFSDVFNCPTNGVLSVKGSLRAS
ncbi:hypothetical protein MGSAQ_001327 [marine sediment metagenome]|uniref:Uncharacterized protein n=1 Tax=marine sediment metagenome TaxID=412755 RepID=A0A1B6NUP1_9ZZZZ